MRFWRRLLNTAPAGELALSPPGPLHKHLLNLHLLFADLHLHFA
jgi:hypothetical protein